jgi:hypothetical protein
MRTMIRSIALAVLLAGCHAPPWGVVLLIPEPVPNAAELDPRPVYQLRHVGVEYPTREACAAVWADRCAPKVMP